MVLGWDPRGGWQTGREVIDELDDFGTTRRVLPEGLAEERILAPFDPEEWAYTTTAERPCVIGRQRIGRIAIANADAAASPHTDAAINEAYRAVGELLAG